MRHRNLVTTLFSSVFALGSMNTHRIPSQGKPLTKLRFYIHYLALAEELYTASEPHERTPNLSDQRRRRLYGSALFLAFALESFINETSLEYCPDDFEIIERLRAPDKWYLVPKLCGRKPFERDKQPFQAISEIFTYRNYFAHYTPQFREDDCKEYQHLRKIDHPYVENLYKNTIQAMQMLRDEFQMKSLAWLDDKVLV